MTRKIVRTKAKKHAICSALMRFATETNSWQRAGTWRYRALQSRRFLLRDVRRGRAGRCMGRAFDPELGSNSAPGAIRLQDASAKLLGSEENGIFVTAAVRSALFGTPPHNRLQPIALVPLPAALAGIKVYRLCNAS